MLSCYCIRIKTFALEFLQTEKAEFEEKGLKELPILRSLNSGFRTFDAGRGSTES